MAEDRATLAGSAAPCLACVAVRAPGLVLVRRRRPDWSALPHAAADHLAPTGTILDACPRARRAGVVPGLTLAAARARLPELRIEAISMEDLHRFSAEVFRILVRAAPFVEPLLHAEGDAGRPSFDALADAGTFFLDASGLGTLYGDAEGLRHRIETILAETGLAATVVVGFHRLRIYALARHGGRGRVFYDPTDEARCADRLPLAILPLDPKIRGRLERLGLRTVGDLARLPAAELRTRFGRGASRFHERLHRDGMVPIAPRPVREPARAAADVEPPDDHAERLTFVCRGLIDAVCRATGRQLRAVAAVRIRLTLDVPAEGAVFGIRRRTVRLRIALSRPTLDASILADLLRLRLAALALPGRVERVEIVAEPAPAEAGQLALLDQPARDPEAARAALARLEAAFGPGTVTFARLRAEALP
ncbi:MAG: DNA polymerase Y family protein, partial [Deltaproteobacteria bacterium]